MSRLSMVAAVAVLAAKESSAVAQTVAHVGTAYERTDSVAMLRAARAAQSRFERIRFNNLPWAWSGGGDKCDEIIGRYCITHGDSDDDWRPPPEPPRVVAGRAALISKLDSVAHELRGDSWISGQLIRYLLEADRHAEAYKAAQACGSESWWCAALTALVEHDSGRFQEADSLFGIALTEMPQKERLRWTNLEMVLTGEDLRIYRQSTQERRDSLASRFWWLADPFWMREGNDRRTEHYARFTIDRIHRDSRTPEGAFWGRDLGEILIRYGAMAGWERVRPLGIETGPPGVVGHFTPNGREFLPAIRWLDKPFSIDAHEWPLGEDGTRTEYGPPYAKSFHELEHQLAVFRRGDSAIVVASYRLPADSTPASASVELGLIVASDERTNLAISRGLSVGTQGVLNAIIPATPGVVSIEALTDSGSRAYRARYGLAITPVLASALAISDVMLLDGAAGGEPSLLAEAIPRARGSVEVRSAERVAMYWEVYGLRAQQESLEVELALEPLEHKWLHRAAERLRLRAEPPSVLLRWRELSDGKEMMSRSLELQLPRLPKGRYVLRVTVRRGPEEAVIQRQLRAG